MKIAVLTTCYNRKETTVRCLDAFVCAAREAAKQVKVKGDCEAWNYQLYLVDDGSTDGTGEAVRKWFAENRPLFTFTFNLHLIRGSGSLYWAKGMELAWRTASQHTFDGYLWLNDDVDISSTSLSTLLHLHTANSKSVLVGELENTYGEIVYGTRGDLFTGNFVFVPRSVYEKVGMICGEYHHAWADSDYAMRCKRAGVPVVSCGVVGECEGHPNRPSLKGLALRQRWAMLFNPKGWNLHDLWLYRWRNWGLCAAIVSCIHLIGHVLRGEH